MTRVLVGDTWVLIPAHRPALNDLHGCLAELGWPASRVVVVTNGPDPIRPGEVPATVITDPGGVNISRWWNLGLNHITRHAPRVHEVLVLNADTRVSDGAVVRLRWVLRAHGLAMTGPDQSRQLADGAVHIDTTPGAHGLRWRIPGWCFLLAGETHLRADPQFRWYCGDDDLEWRARRYAGTGLVGGVRAVHLHPDGHLYGELERIAADDVERFTAKWGCKPW